MTEAPHVSVLLGEVVEIEGALLHALGDFLRLVLVDVERRLLDQ